MKKCVSAVLLLIVYISLNGSSLPSEEELLEKLKNCDYAECPTVVEWCGLLKVRKAVPLLVQLLENRKEDRYIELRTEIIRALGKIGEPDAIGILLRCLPHRAAISALDQIDPNWKLRRESEEYFARQLDEFYKNANGGDRRRPFNILLSIDFSEQQVKNLCLDVLTKKEIDKYIIARSVQKLVEMKALEAIDPLMARLENIAANDYNMGKYFLKALDSLLPDWRLTQHGKEIEERIILEFKRIKAGIPKPIDVCNESTPENYTDHIELLTWYPSGVSLLLEAVRDKQEFVDFRLQAMRALGDIAKPGDTHILCALIELLSHENPTMSLTALQELNNLGKRYNGTAPADPDAREIIDRLLCLLENQDPEEFPRHWIIDGLLIWGDELVAPVLLNLLKKKTNTNQYTDRTFLILDKLIKLGNPETFAVVTRLYNSAGEDQNWRELYIKIMGELKDPRALPLLQEALTDKDRRVRAYAEWAIYHITKE